MTPGYMHRTRRVWWRIWLDWLRRRRVYLGRRAAPMQRCGRRYLARCRYLTRIWLVPRVQACVRGNLARVRRQRDRVLPYLTQRLSHSMVTDTDKERGRDGGTERERAAVRETLLLYHCTNHRQGAGEAMAFESAIDAAISYAHTCALQPNQHQEHHHHLRSQNNGYDQKKYTERVPVPVSKSKLRRVEIVGNSLTRFTPAIFALLQRIEFQTITELSISTPTHTQTYARTRTHTHAHGKGKGKSKSKSDIKAEIWKIEREMGIARHPLRSSHAIEPLCILLWPSKLTRTRTASTMIPGTSMSTVALLH